MFIFAPTYSAAPFVPPSSTGLTLCGTGTDLADGSFPWMNPNDITLDDNTPASCGVKNDGFTNTISATNYGFAISGGSIISGVTIEAKIMVDTPDTLLWNDNRVALTYLGAEIGTPDTAAANLFTDSYVVYTWGSSIDMWGYALDPTTINDISFGCNFKFQRLDPSNTGVIYIDYVKMNIYYH